MRKRLRVLAVLLSLGVPCLGGEAVKFESVKLHRHRSGEDRALIDRYRLASPAEDANGFEMELSAGEPYYFLRNTLEGRFRRHTALAPNRPEVTRRSDEWLLRCGLVREEMMRG